MTAKKSAKRADDQSLKDAATFEASRPSRHEIVNEAIEGMRSDLKKAKMTLHA